MWKWQPHWEMDKFNVSAMNGCVDVSSWSSSTYPSSIRICGISKQHAAIILLIIITLLLIIIILYVIHVVIYCGCIIHMLKVHGMFAQYHR